MMWIFMIKKKKENDYFVDFFISKYDIHERKFQVKMHTWKNKLMCKKSVLQCWIILIKLHIFMGNWLFQMCPNF